MIELDQIKFELTDAHENLSEMKAALGMDDLSARLAEITKTSEQEGFWDDHRTAQKLLKEKKALEDKIQSWQNLAGELEDIEVMIDLAEEEDDKSLAPEIQSGYEKWKKELDALRLSVLLDG